MKPIRNKSPKIKMGIIGYGIVGKALDHVFKTSPNVSIMINDVVEEDGVEIYTIEKIVETCQIVFVCVPTPMTSVEGGKINPRIINEVCDQIISAMSELESTPHVCIKSTITPDVLQEIQNKWPNRKLAMSPEYLTEANYLEDMINMRALVVGSDNPKTLDYIEELFKWHSSCRHGYPVGRCSLIGASLLKYMENSFLATKVIFMNQFYGIYEKMGLSDSWEDIAGIFQLDSERMGTSHWRVPGPDGDRGFGGKCLPKDLNAIISYMDDNGVNSELLKMNWS